MSKSPLSAAHFNSEEAARKHLEGVRWPEGTICPHCGTVGTAYARSKPGLWRCAEKECRKDFTVTIGTIFERSHIPLATWFKAIYYLCSSKKGMSSHQLHRTMGVTYKTAWFMTHRIREAMAPAKGDASTLGGEGKYVEADTTLVGGKEKNKHARKRHHAGTGAVGKQIVHTLVERGGRARSDHIANISGKTLRPIVVKQVSLKSAFMTDEAGEYFHLGKEFARHERVNHSAGEYVRGDAHSNTVESYFATLKRGIVGTYHNVSEAHLKRYLAEFDFRYNERSALGVDDATRTEKAIKGAIGKRLTYRRPDVATA